MLSQTTSVARNVQVAGRNYGVRPPRWGEWQAAMAAGLVLSPGLSLDAAALLEACLLPCVTGPEGALTLAALRALPTSAGDGLLTAALDLLESERERLNLQRTEEGDGALISGEGLQLRLRPWSFGERNRALATCLRLVDGEPILDLGSFERMMVCTCATRITDGIAHHLGPSEVVDWPVPLGEVVVQALDELNGVDPVRDAVLKACIERGQSHPDLTLIHLCRTFGWTPTVVEGLEARQAERLLAALRALEAPPLAARPQATTHSDSPREVTRIIVESD
jgi:hypothetical protein